VTVGLAQLVGKVMDVDLPGARKRGIMRVAVRIGLDCPVLLGAYFDAGEEGGVRRIWYHENVRRLCKNCWRLGRPAESCLVAVETAKANKCNCPGFVLYRRLISLKANLSTFSQS